MKYDLVQYSCDVCGTLTSVLDVDQSLPKGWVMVSRLTHLCPRCAKHIDIEKTDLYSRDSYDIDKIIDDLKKEMKGE